METVNHTKEPSGGYTKGSPLYKKQQARKDGNDKSPALPKGMSEAKQPVAYQYLPDFAGMARGKQPSVSESLASGSVYAIFVLAFACLYKATMAEPTRARVKGEAPSDLPVVTRCGFAYSFFDCSSFQTDFHICLWSCCCPIIQWAGTSSQSAAPFMSYWASVLLMLILVCLIPFTYGLTGLVILAVLLMRRRQLRKVYAHTHPGARSWIEDLCLVFCCNSFLCCQLVQEAREVEYTSPKQLEAPTRFEVPGSRQINGFPLTSQGVQYSTVQYAR